MIGRPAARRAPYSLGAAALIISCYSMAGIVAAVVPGLNGAGRTMAVGAALASIAGTAAWVAAPRLAAPAPPRLPPPPVAHPFPETERLASRLRFDRQLDRALEDAGDERGVFDVTARALETIPPGSPAELLLVGGKRRRLIQVAEAGPDGEGPGCPVSERLQCDAIRKNRTMRFPSSDDLDACRHLSGRNAVACSAICVPVRILGEAVGVIHRAGTVRSPATELDVSYVESLAGRVEARLSMLRLSRSESPAAALDDTTGVYTQATLEERIADLAHSRTPFALAQCDIDHFAEYAARHGEDAADDALRTLGRAAQRCLRPDDLLGRGGCDELLAVFPETSAHDARRALERLREELLLELNERNQAPFTVSFGVIESSFGQHLDELLVQVDAATSLAKDLGRNRVVLAGEAALEES